jgi:hypothetical protein
MAPRNRFSPFGTFGESFVSHQLRKLLATRAALVEGQVLDIETVDLSYKTYKRDNVTANDDCIRAFPCPENNKPKKAHVNYYESIARFKTWYRTGNGESKQEVDMCFLYQLMPNLTRVCCCLCIAGYSSCFAARAGGQGIDPGSDDSSLSDTVTGDHDNADSNHQGDNSEEEDNESDHSNAPTAITPTPI